MTSTVTSSSYVFHASGTGIVEPDRPEGGKFEVKAANAPFGELSAKTEVARSPSVVSRSKAGVTIHVKKKLPGILVSFSGDEALVIFDNKGESVEYWLPAKLLRENGVTVSDQPFELLESEIKDGHELILQSKIKPLAPASSATIEPLPLSKVYKAKRDFLLKKSKSSAA